MMRALLQITNLRHHWRTMVAIWVFVFGGIAIYALTAPDTYRSAGTLYVRLGRENVSVDPTANFGQGQMSALPMTRENEINTVVESLRSRTLLEQVVDDIGAEVILKDQKRIIDYIRTPSMPQREYAIMRLEKMVKVAARRKSNLVGVSVDARNAEVARLAANSLVNRFVTFHRDLNRNPKAHQFFENQANLLKDQLHVTENELTDLRNRVQVSAPEEQRQMLLRRLSDLDREIHLANTEIEQARTAISVLGGQKENQAEHRVQETAVVANQAKSGMRERLYELEMREKLLAARFSDKHPELIQVREQYEQARKSYDNEKDDRTNVTKGRNRAHEQTELTLLERQAELAELETRRAALAPQIAALQKQLSELNEADMKLTRLERQRDIQADSFTKYAHSLEQTRIDESLRSNQISNISVADAPAHSYKPISPDRPLLIALGAAAATILAAAFAVAIEQWPSQRPEASHGTVHGPGHGTGNGAGNGQSRQYYLEAEPEHV